MVVHAATIKERRGEHSRRRWRVGVLLFVAVNATAYSYGHLWFALCVTSILMVWVFGFSSEAEEEEKQFLSGKDSRLSAYSVFNAGFKELPGTLNAAGIDRELRGRGGDVNKQQGYKRSRTGAGSGHRWGKGNKLG